MGATGYGKYIARELGGLGISVGSFPPCIAGTAGSNRWAYGLSNGVCPESRRARTTAAVSFKMVFLKARKTVELMNGFLPYSSFFKQINASDHTLNAHFFCCCMCKVIQHEGTMLGFYVDALVEAGSSSSESKGASLAKKL